MFLKFFLIASISPDLHAGNIVQVPTANLCLDMLSGHTPSHNRIERPIIHSPITDRSYEEVLAILEEIDHLKPRDAPRFDVQKIYNGASVLSLGEGRSNFIATLLNLQPEGMKSAYAIDAQVLNAPAGYESQYIPAFFQNLNLIDSETGEQAQFDFMFSLYSFYFVVTKGRGISSDLDKMLEVLKRHLKPGGVLVIIPSLREATFPSGIAQHPGLRFWQGKAEDHQYTFSIIQRTD